MKVKSERTILKSVRTKVKSVRSIH